MGRVNRAGQATGCTRPGLRLSTGMALMGSPEGGTNFTGRINKAGHAQYVYIYTCVHERP